MRGLHGDVCGEPTLRRGDGGQGLLLRQIGIQHEFALRDRLVRFEREFDGGAIQRFEIALVGGDRGFLPAGVSRWHDGLGKLHDAGPSAGAERAPGRDGIRRMHAVAHIRLAHGDDTFKAGGAHAGKLGAAWLGAFHGKLQRGLCWLRAFGFDDERHF